MPSGATREFGSVSAGFSVGWGRDCRWMGGEFPLGSSSPWDRNRYPLAGQRDPARVLLGEPRELSASRGECGGELFESVNSRGLQIRGARIGCVPDSCTVFGASDHSLQRAAGCRYPVCCFAVCRAGVVRMSWSGAACPKVADRIVTGIMVRCEVV
jgi:hypothetical protein